MTIGSLHPNRITRAVEAQQDMIDERLASGKVTPERLAELEETLALTGSDHFQYQQIQARAHVSQMLTLDEAQYVYAALNGEMPNSANGGWADGVTLAQKVVVTQLMTELLAQKLGVQLPD